MDVEVFILEAPIQREHYCLIGGLVDWLWAGNPRFQFDVLLPGVVANPMLILEPIARLYSPKQSKQVRHDRPESLFRSFVRQRRTDMRGRSRHREGKVMCLARGAKTSQVRISPLALKTRNGDFESKGRFVAIQS